MPALANVALQAAEAAFRQVLKLSPRSSLAAANLARLYRSQGREDAEHHGMDGVCRLHERCVKRGRNARDDLIPDKNRQREHIQGQPDFSCH